MIGRIEARLRLLRRKLSRTHWLLRFLHLSTSEGPANRPGLVMVQIDGLSLEQFNHALDKGKLPFLKRLIKREHYQVHTQYSGLPSSTPAVQGEIFYGIKTVVPAFSFLDREKGEMVRMFEPATAQQVEHELREQLARDGGDALCTGGSSYSNVFGGGADQDEAHFCASSLGWGSALRAANPFALLFMLVANINSVIRILILLVVELVIAPVDVVRGLYNGHNYINELKFIPARVAICVLLRELCVIGGKMDIQRGLPIVHINFLGYDEQSHRRGPGSLFAHWTLKGIDNAVERLWREAAHAPRRHYEVWVYSDHGQSRTTSYFKQQGYTILKAVNAAYAGLDEDVPSAAGRKRAPGMEAQRARLLGGSKVGHLFSARTNGSDESNGKVQVAGLGPVAFAYFPEALEPAELARAARALAVRHNVPAVVSGRGEEHVRVWTADGEFLLPQQSAELFGEDHPFIDVIGEDLERLCRHRHAGDLTLLGWRKGVAPITFADENGSHAGLTHEETRAFSLLPMDAPLPDSTRGYHRPCDLREAALQHLGRPTPATLPKRAQARRERSPAPHSEQVRVMTYNVHSCVGIDGKLASERIARVIAQANPDVVALQELDAGRARTGGEDQAQRIAHYLKMRHHFHPHIHVENEKYGDAILTHLPMRIIKSGPLPGHLPGGTLEPRGAIWVAIDLHGTEVNIVNTHLGLTSRERVFQIEALLGDDWLGRLNADHPVILCGDFNAVPSSKGYKLLRGRFLDAQAELKEYRPVCTFYSRLPSFRIDHVFIQPGIQVTGITVPCSELAKVASDHLPLIADLTIPCPDAAFSEDPQDMEDARNMAV
ncbi:MAG: endonuclease/exonuclease/phosphatase family protein [Salinivirgaceae bacterium]|nr:endonuclease/exonuclease/phosphatase family protein [Salinivirgaceae bacterium]